MPVAFSSLDAILVDLLFQFDTQKGRKLPNETVSTLDDEHDVLMLGGGQTIGHHKGETKNMKNLPLFASFHQLISCFNVTE